MPDAFVSGTRQLTFSGKRAGEGYFSADGKRMIFQSEREAGNPFYQIYLLDFETGDTTPALPWHRKDDLRLAAPGRAAVSVCLHACGSRLAGPAGRRIEGPRRRQTEALFLGLR